MQYNATCINPFLKRARREFADLWRRLYVHGASSYRPRNENRGGGMASSHPRNARFACEGAARTRATVRDPSSLIERDRNRCRPICLNFGGEATEKRFRATFCARLSSLVSTTGQEERYQRFTVVTRPPFIAAGHRRPGEIATSRLRFRCRSTLISPVNETPVSDIMTGHACCLNYSWPAALDKSSRFFARGRFVVTKLTFTNLKMYSEYRYISTIAVLDELIKS